MNDTIGLLIKDALWSGVAAAGFAVLFNVPRRMLWGCAVTGALGHSLRALLMEFGVPIEIGTLIGAITLGFLGLLLARHFEVPAPIFTVSGAITMVPGVFAYRAMIGLLTLASEDANGQVLLETAVNATQTLLILGGIAGGIIAPGLLLYRHKPVV